MSRDSMYDMVREQSLEDIERLHLHDNGEILHEAGCYREQLKRIDELEEQRPGRAQDEHPKT
jgi:hypothetical protein